MRVLITRPREDAEPLAARLRAIGVDARIEPLLSIAFTPGPAPVVDGVQAVLATSANGVRALAAAAGRRDVPLFAVGDATARAARDLGFVHVESAAGDVDQLATLVANLCDPAGGTLLHVAGSEVAGDLGRILETAGFSYRRAVLYAARKAERLSDGSAAALKSGDLDAVLFFSPRTAETFVSLVRKARLAKSCRPLRAICLSEAVAERARAIAWREVAVAARPDQESLIALLRPTTGTPWGDMKKPKKTESQAADGTDDAAPRPDGTAAGGESPLDMTPSDIEPRPEPAEQPAGEAAPEAAAPTAEETGPRAEPAVVRSVSRRSVVPALVLWTLLVFAVVGGAVYAAWPFLSPYAADFVRSAQQDPFQDARMAGLVERVGNLEKLTRTERPANEVLDDLERQRAEIGAQVTTLMGRVDELEKSLQAVRDIVKATNLPQQAADAKKSLQELSERIALIEKTGDVSQLRENVARLGAENQQMSAAVAALSSRVKGLAETETAVSAKTRAIILAAGQLRAVLHTAAPFAKELDALGKAAAGQPDLVNDIAGLAPFAATGIPTLATLRDRFAGIAREVARAARRVEGEGWLARVANRLASLVTIRRTTVDDDGDPTDIALARAGAALGEGDLISAVAALEGLGGDPAKAAQPWLKEARARVTAERVMAVLHVHEVSLMGVAGK